MVWNEKDKAAVLYILVELAAQMQPEEIFNVLLQVGKVVSDRAGGTAGFDRLPRPAVATCLRRCLEKSGLL